MIINVLIFIGPFLFLAVRQIRSYEPGDADWGVKLEHVRGQTEAKDEIQRVINLWQAGDEFKAAGGKPERGLLFLGAPGTGKTMLAKAIATGFNSPFVTVPGSGFAGMFIGMDILAVQFLGWKAKKLARKWGGQCVVFIDEIDAVGMRRNSLVSSSVGQDLMPTSIHDVCFYGSNGALTASGDVVLKDPAWSERMFHARAETQARGGAQAFLGAIGRKLSTMNVVGGMGMMNGGGGALNQLLVLMDGIDEPPLLRRTVTNRVNTLLDASYVVPPSHRQGAAAHRAPQGPHEQRVLHRSLQRLARRARPRAHAPGPAGGATCASASRSSTTASTSSTTTLGKVQHNASLDTVKARDELARMTDGYSPAMIEQICSMALTYAHHDERQEFERDDILEAITTIESGSAVNVEYIDSETRATAIHEAGHAVASHIYGEGFESTRLSIRMPRTLLRAVTPHAARKSGTSSFRSEEIAGLIWTVGAMAAEQVFYGRELPGRRRRHAERHHTGHDDGRRLVDEPEAHRVRRQVRHELGGAGGPREGAEAPARPR